MITEAFMLLVATAWGCLLAAVLVVNFDLMGLVLL